MLASQIAVPPSKGRALDRAGIMLSYWWRHGRLPDLETPALFTEWVQHRKLHDHDPRMPLLADKVAAKAFVAERLGSRWLIPPLWQGPELPQEAVWPTPFVVKARHGCNQSCFVFDDSSDWAKIRRASRSWMRSRYGGWLSEWLYRDIPRGLLVEPFIGTGGALPIDYKFYVFGGRVECVQVHLGRGDRHRWIIFDRAWRRISGRSRDPDPDPPSSLKSMIAAAERLAGGFSFVRVDLYNVSEGPLFGEMTFYPGSGLDPFNPVTLDAKLGGDWQAALRGRQVGMQAAA